MCGNHNGSKINRRQALTGGLAATAGAAALTVGASAANAQSDPYAEPANPALAPSKMKLDLSRAALVVTDHTSGFFKP